MRTEEITIGSTRRRPSELDIASSSPTIRCIRKKVTIGAGTLIGSGSDIESKVQIGSGVTIVENVTIPKGTVVPNGATVQ